MPKDAGSPRSTTKVLDGVEKEIPKRESVHIECLEYSEIVVF